MNTLTNAAHAAARASFTEALADGRAMPLLVPYSLLGTFLVPVLWLTIPHTRRPILYQTRWLVAAFIVAFNARLTRQSSSKNFAIAYAIGLTTGWGIIWNLNLLIWTRPQFDAARAVRVLHRQEPTQTTDGAGKSRSPSEVKNTTAEKNAQVIGADAKATVTDESFVWQPFPADGPFLQRLGWVLDLFLSFRGSGWNWSTSAVPRPQIPSKIQPGMALDLRSMPRVSKSGYERCLSGSEFVRKRLTSIILLCPVLDLCSVLLLKDPYMVLGPEYSEEPPSHLHGVPPWLLYPYRQALALVAILAMLQAVFSTWDLVHYWIFKACFPCRAALCFHASPFGAASQIRDRGLAGVWGGFWHQTFRIGFTAPVTYLTRNGYLEGRSIASIVLALFVSFLQSGLLHAFASITSLPDTEPWRPLACFVLQAVGVLVQVALQQISARVFPEPPRVIAQAANLLFTAVWLSATGTFFLDDVVSAGLGTVEPVPISPLRWLGYGDANDHWLRWGRDYMLRWHNGRRWWESGIAL